MAIALLISLYNAAGFPRRPPRGAVYFRPYGSCRLARRRDRRDRGNRTRDGLRVGAGGSASRDLRTHRSQCTRHGARPEGGRNRRHRHAVRRFGPYLRGCLRGVRNSGAGRAAGAREQRRDRAVQAARGALARRLGRDDGRERALPLSRHAGISQGHVGRRDRHHREHRFARGEERRRGRDGVLRIQARRAGVLQEPDARGAQARPPRRGDLPGLRGDAVHGQTGAPAPRPRPRPHRRRRGARRALHADSVGSCHDQRSRHQANKPLMLDPIRRLLTEAGKAKQTRAFWQAATDILSEWAGGARVQLTYKGLNESGTREAGAAGQEGETFLTDYHDAEGRHVSARFEGLPTGVPGEVLRSTIEIAIDASATGRVIRTGEPFLTDNILTEAEAQRALSPSGMARAAMIAPLRTSSGVAGAVGVVRYVRAGAEEPLPFTLMELQYLTAVAAYIAGGLELSEAVSGARAAAERAHAMVDGSPLPMALVERSGRVQQLNQAACRLLGIPSEAQALGMHLEALGLSPSEISLHLVLARPRDGTPWHGRVLVTQPSGDRRICDCTITGLSGVGPVNLLVALYDRTDELRAQRELIAREKLATVGEIASGVAHEVNNPLAAIRMEAELLGRASKDPDTSTTAATITREVDRAARSEEHTS